MYRIIAVVALASVTSQPAAVPDKAYWKGIAAARFEVPAGATVQQLAPQLLGVLF